MKQKSFFIIEKIKKKHRKCPALRVLSPPGPPPPPPPAPRGSLAEDSQSWALSVFFCIFQ